MVPQSQLRSVYPVNSKSLTSTLLENCSLSISCPKDGAMLSVTLLGGFNFVWTFNRKSHEYLSEEKPDT